MTSTEAAKSRLKLQIFKFTSQKILSLDFISKSVINANVDQLLVCNYEQNGSVKDLRIPSYIGMNRSITGRKDSVRVHCRQGW